MLARDQKIHIHVANSLQIPRMSSFFSSGHIIEQRVRLQTSDSAISIFDGIIVLRSFTKGTANSLPTHCPANTWSPSGSRCYTVWMVTTDIFDAPTRQSQYQVFTPRSSPDTGRLFGAGRDLCFHFEDIKMKFYAAKAHCEEYSQRQSTRGGQNFGMYQPRKESEAHTGELFMGKYTNYWLNNIRIATEGDCGGSDKWYPPLFADSWWDRWGGSNEPSCDNDETVVQMRANTWLNDENPSNDQTKVLCQSEPLCNDCSTAQCALGKWRTTCHEHQNYDRHWDSRRKSDNECLDCYQPNCGLHTYRTLCDGWGTKLHGPERRSNNCPLCTYGPAFGGRAEKKCARGFYTSECPGTLHVDNFCVVCDTTPCFNRPELAITEFGYYRERCTDNFAYKLLQDECVACSQTCQYDIYGRNGGPGWWRPGCNNQDFNSEPSCSLCNFANEAAGNNICPPTQFLVLCENGFSEQVDDNSEITRRVGQNSCNSCPPHMFSTGNAQSIDDCKCSPGARPKTDAEKITDPALGCKLCEYSKFGACFFHWKCM